MRTEIIMSLSAPQLCDIHDTSDESGKGSPDEDCSSEGETAMLELCTLNTPPSCRLFFNTSANVGIGQANDPIDVQLVQFGYAARSNNARSTSSATAKAIYAKVVPGAPYQGRPDEPLSQAIIIDQRERGGPQDGHISRMRGGLKYSGPRGEQGFMLLTVSNNLYDAYTDIWPRIDKAPGCPGALAGAIRALFRNE